MQSMTEAIMHNYENPVNSFTPMIITPRQTIEQIIVAEAERVDIHICHQSADDVDRLLRALRAAAVNGEFLVEIGGGR